MTVCSPIVSAQPSNHLPFDYTLIPSPMLFGHRPRKVPSQAGQHAKVVVVGQGVCTMPMHAYDLP